MTLRIPLDENERRILATFVITYGLSIVTWAFLHDLHLISVEPRHFTEYHRPLLPLSNHGLLALQYATVATLGPGMAFGAVTFAVCRLGSWPRIGAGPAWRTFLPFVAAIEISALLTGALARSRHAAGLSLPYPEMLYPDTTAGIAYSQSVNITAYLAAVIFGAGYQLTLLIRRRLATARTRK
ncbi:MAG: hypothetical protein K0R17_1895 [Rariglobus sp.]|jgi:hypothetical protein|nr:hypothetical protein [Rariglobus sp.]